MRVHTGPVHRCENGSPISSNAATELLSSESDRAGLNARESGLTQVARLQHSPDEIKFISPIRTRCCSSKAFNAGPFRGGNLSESVAGYIEAPEIVEGPGRSFRACSCATSALRYRAVVVRFVWPNHSDTACMG